MLLLVVGSTGSALALELHGDVLVQYRDGQRSIFGPGTRSTDQKTVHMQLASIFALHDFTEYIRGGFRISSPQGVGLTMPEAWIAFDGLPWSGTLTMGRFFPPGGEAVPTLSVSIPTILYRSQAQQGVKLAFEPADNWRMEAGFVNMNALSLTGAVIGDAFVFARPTGFASHNNMRGYYNVGYQNGGEWGSLDLSATAYLGEMSEADRALINGTGMYGGTVIDKKHQVIDLSADYIKGPWRLYGQWVQGDEGDFRQNAYEASGSYRRGDWTYMLSYGDHDVNARIQTKAQTRSWDRTRLTYSVAWQVYPNMKIQAEYEQNRENFRSGTVNPLESGHNPVENDVIGVQAHVSF